MCIYSSIFVTFGCFLAPYKTSLSSVSPPRTNQSGDASDGKSGRYCSTQIVRALEPQEDYVVMVLLIILILTISAVFCCSSEANARHDPVATSDYINDIH